ncbi:hypothetical protein MNBD_GAMMA13-800 [hydrothermal vent metagenome]|uniref:ApeI dehydratase-like domain-containing protein n=1 Tax=hydrothermal vent metagenome TaxID=652676 RepID=A0A3B0YPG6_9ZZZZ
MFEFHNIALSGDGAILTASCLIDPANPCFNGHFPGHPLLPAVAQIGLLEALMASATGWNKKICGGSALKFLQPVLPGEQLELRLERQGADTLYVSFTCDGSLKSKGQLHTCGVALV